MPTTEHGSNHERQRERRAKTARRFFALYCPRPPLLGGFTKERGTSKAKPSDGDFLVATRGSMRTDAFSGASPVVASASGIRSGATPRGQVHTTIPRPADPSKQDISTLLGIGHFYFALTIPRPPASPGFSRSEEHTSELQSP